MKNYLLFGLLMILGFTALGNSAFSVNSHSKEHTILVYVNGKLIQNERKRYIRHKSTPGFHVLKVKVYDQKGKMLSTINQRIYIKSGFENNYQINAIGSKKELRKLPLYPLYSNFFYNPALYTRNSIIA
ncbi:MAG TPA: hypothetical protein PKC24_11950 [Cyclobacteriaceae bacterium]|nr:hypothetical protein [Cyclobacteriaceae bacterium]